MNKWRNPAPTSDIIIEVANSGIVLIRRKNPSAGWALPGRFIDYGESAEDAAVREAQEETMLAVQLIELLHLYSLPCVTRVNIPLQLSSLPQRAGHRGADDAAEAGVFHEGSLPPALTFDHTTDLHGYFASKRTGQRPQYH